MFELLELTAEVERRLRLSTFPLAVKRLGKARDLETIEGISTVAPRSLICQLIAYARQAGSTVVATQDNVLPCPLATVGGLLPIPDKEPASRVGLWFKTLEDAQKQFEAFPRLPDRCQAIVFSPVAFQKFDPDVVLLYGNPAQIILLVNALQWTDYNSFEFSFLGESSCVAMYNCYLTGKPTLNLICYGERVTGAADNEVVMVLPPHMLKRAVNGLRQLDIAGIRYPISTLANRGDPMIIIKEFYSKGAIAAREQARDEAQLDTFSSGK